MRGIFDHFLKKEDYEDSVPQYPGSSSAIPIIAQPATLPINQAMMSMGQPINMAGHQVVQTPYGQAFITPSATTMLNDNGQVYAQSASVIQPGVNQPQANTTTLLNSTPTEAADIPSVPEFVPEIQETTEANDKPEAPDTRKLPPLKVNYEPNASKPLIDNVTTPPSEVNGQTVNDSSETGNKQNNF